MYNVDENLIAQAKMKATGATIHNIINAACYYRSCAGLCKAYRKNHNPRLSDWEEGLNLVEKRLRIFVLTGKLITYEEARERINNG